MYSKATGLVRCLCQGTSVSDLHDFSNGGSRLVLVGIFSSFISDGKDGQFFHFKYVSCNAQKSPSKTAIKDSKLTEFIQ